MLLFLLWGEGEHWWKFSSDPRAEPAKFCRLRCSFTCLGFIWLLMRPLYSKIIKVSAWLMADNVIKIRQFRLRECRSHLQRQIPGCFASLLRISASFSISITVSAPLSALEYRHIVAALDSLVFGMWVVSCQGGREEEMRGERGSLNKSPSVYLIYGAIRSVRYRLKLNFSSCEAS